jgi:hypothetical protein
MVELYGMLAFMYPDVFTTPGPFEAAFNLVKGTVSGKGGSDGWVGANSGGALSVAQDLCID